MDIKIGFNDSPRELVISTDRAQDEVLAQVQQALASAEPSSVTLDDDKGRKYVVRSSSIAYVEVGSTHAHPVGFIN
ncbi:MULTISPECIES: DUF3107 domain-containing protein [unclassified Corynebacterium]|uniref:DUF3107 domain-containing protein n=1 Tax=unclassified Corynebacterium TaxID=2624378 RepID=UPI001C45F3FE|nr:MULTISPECIES: DUF3107 domain-containing protein [unclassified Corynebacterium]MBV7282742.1 DUF3107 domain-containing protein [Corynebacterium sp. TAE3-ERU30]MBV7302871.1 DUF3107 domain-containing protein [Corynebacterium sp. TAE3-ERU2]